MRLLCIKAATSHPPLQSPPAATLLSLSLTPPHPPTHHHHEKQGVMNAVSGLLGTAVKLLVAWRVAPHIPAAIAKMGGCLSVVLDNKGLRSRVATLEQQLAAGGNGGAGVAAAGAEALFFPDPAMPCRNGKSCRRSNCTYAHENTSLLRLLQWIGAAKSTLDVCVFSITCDELSDALLAARGACVKGGASAV